MTLIFIIEDNESVADSLVYFIKYLSRYETIIATSGELAYDTLMKGVKPDLILLDVKLPGMDGIDFLSKIRRDPRLMKINVMIYSGIPPDVVRKDLEARNIYVHSILQKPASPKHLVAVIAEELKKH